MRDILAAGGDEAHRDADDGDGPTYRWQKTEAGGHTLAVVGDDGDAAETDDDGDDGVAGLPSCPECGTDDVRQLSTGEWVCQSCTHVWRVDGSGP